MLPKHIQIARSKGVEAGLEAYLAAPASKIHPAFKRISAKKKPETRLAAYQAEFEDKLGSAVKANSTGSSTQQNTLVQAILNALGGGNIEPVEEVEEAEVEVVEDDPAQMIAQAVAAAVQAATGGTAPVASRKAPAAHGVITSGIAWRLLNEDGDFPEPRSPEAPATNGQLYRLNTQGRMEEAVEAALAS